MPPLQEAAQARNPGTDVQASLQEGPRGGDGAEWALRSRSLRWVLFFLILIFFIEV